MKKNFLLILVLLLPFLANAQCTTTNATSCICKNGGVNCDLLPDIHVAEPPMYVNGSAGYIEYPQVCPGGCSGNDGRLRLSVSTPNVGFGPLEVRALPTAICGTDTFYNVASNFVCPNGDPLKQLVVQRVYKKTGNTMTYYDRTAGSMTYHPSHGHMHVDDWGIYTLRTATSDPNPLNWPIIGTGSKLAFCLMDYGTCSTYNGHCEDSSGTIINNSNAPNLGLGGGSYGCSPTIQGISSGYTDIYYQSLDGMWINLPAGLCNGQYWIVVQLDPYNYFLESNELNNVLATPVTLTQQGGSVPVVTASGTTTFCQGGSVTLTATAGGSYLWSNGATTQSITVNASGSYSVTVSNGTACSATSAATVVTVTPISITANATPNAICPGETVALTSSASGSATVNQQVAFTNNTAVFIPDNIATGASSSIAVSGINPASLSSTSVVSVKLNLTHTYDGDLLIQLTSPGGSTINLSNRRGGSGDNFVNTVFTAAATTAIASGVAPFTGNYTPDAAFSALTGNVNGNWTLKVIDQAGQDTGRINNWTLTLNNQVASTISYAWTSNPAGFTSSNQNANVVPSVSTSYTVTATQSGTGCTGSASVAVNVGGNLNVTTNSPAAICAGGSTTLTASGATTYSWSPSLGLSSTTGSSVIANPTATTTYIVIGFNGGCSDTAFVQVVVNSLPLVNAGQDVSICLGTSTTLTATGASSYLWTPSTGLNTTTGSSVIASPITSTTYQVTGTANGCSNSDLVVVTVNANPVVTVNTPAALCPGQVATLTASGAVSYNWSPSTGLNTTTGSTVNAVPLTNTTYTVIGTNGNGCTNSASTTVNVQAGPSTPTTILGNSYHCLPLNTTFSTLPVANATSYTWLTPSNVTVVGGQGSTQILVNGSAAVNGSVCVTASNSCGTSPSLCKIVNAQSSAPATPSTILGTARVCSGNTITFTSSTPARAGYYKWTLPAGAIIVSGDSTNVVNVLFGPTFNGGTLSVYAVNGCGNGGVRTKALTLNTPSTPGTINGNSYGVCNSTQVYTVANISGITYNWVVPTNAQIVSGQGTNSISVVFGAGFLTGNISVTASNNCGVSAARLRTIRAVPAAPVAITGSASVCVGQTGVTYSTALVYGASSYTWTIPTGSTIVSGQGTNSITINVAGSPRTGTVLVRANNACGSSGNRSLAITINACPKIADFTNVGTTNLNLVPNPAKNYVEVVYISVKKGDGNLSITNILGQVKYAQAISAEEGTNNYMIDLRKLVSGVYFLGIEQDGKSVTKRLIIN
jgi:subtilisin-like proprotein convertase family protein